jgi:hypothetical protein
MRDRDERTPAQWFCLVVGAVLVLAGLFGFLADSAFDTGNGADSLNGDTLLGLEVNGWHNLVHIASGAFLLAMAARHASARTAALAFAGIYAVVTVIGMVDGHDVLGFMPVNPADNVLHLVLALAGLAAGLAPARRDHDRGTRRGEVVGETPTAGRTQPVDRERVR